MEQQLLCCEGTARENDVQFEGSSDNDNSDVLVSQTSTQTQRKAPISFDLLRKEAMELCAIGKNNQSAAEFVLNLFREGRARLLATPGVLAPVSVQSLRRNHGNNMPDMYISDKVSQSTTNTSNRTEMLLPRSETITANTQPLLETGRFQLAVVPTDRRGELNSKQTSNNAITF